MKFGIMSNKNNVNVGDDIQALAISYFLPQVDYFIDRERINEFVSDEKEPVAVIMNAWYMWAKWHWPPSKYIVPKFVGFHYADHQLAVQPGSPIKYEFLTGLGGEYLNAYGPIGCRDEFTKNELAKVGVDGYFSGCITLTLPKMEKKDMGKYICLVDVDPRVVKKIKRKMKNTGIEVKVISHNKVRDYEEPWEVRKQNAIDILTVYQNAICVVTKRLHCALPCLAMEVPVFLVKGMQDDIRFTPYYDFMHRTTPDDFLLGKYEYDFANPPENPSLYKSVRENLIKECTQFVEDMKSETRSTDELVKTTYTDDEVIKWRHDVMMETMDMWLLYTRKMTKERTKLYRIIKKTKADKIYESAKAASKLISKSKK